MSTWQLITFSRGLSELPTSHTQIKWSKPALISTLAAVGCHSMCSTLRLWPTSSVEHSLRLLVNPPSGIFHSLICKRIFILLKTSFYLKQLIYCLLCNHPKRTLSYCHRKDSTSGPRFDRCVQSPYSTGNRFVRFGWSGWPQTLCRPRWPGMWDWWRRSCHRCRCGPHWCRCSSTPSAWADRTRAGTWRAALRGTIAARGRK